MGKAEEEVLKVHNERLQALVQGDISKLDQLVADDVIYTSPTGKVQNKAEIVADLRSGALKVEFIGSVDAMVRIYGDTAVVTYGSTTKFRDKGQDISGPLRATAVYVKRQGHWQLVAQQLTRIVQH